MEKEGLSYTSFDSIYEKHDQFEEVYQEIVQTLLQKAERDRLFMLCQDIRLLPSGLFSLLLEYGPKEDIEIMIGGGQSFVDALFQSLKIDPIEGFQLLDGTSLNASTAANRPAYDY